MVSPVIYGVAGESLSADEIDFFKDIKPLGFILFQRNCDNPDQVRALTNELAGLAAIDNPPILIDQEGGRVARLKPPHWAEYPSMQVFGDMLAAGNKYAAEALKLNCMLIGDDLRRLGITVDCLPCLDLPQSDADPIIGDRAFSNDPYTVGALGRVAIDGLAQSGVLPVIKHIPGHGRALVDSHKELPVVDADRESLEDHDFIPFRMLHDAPFAMTAHVTYLAYDMQDCATHSATIIDEVIRQKLGFKGFLMSDDLSMQALRGELKSRTERALAVGCDIALHCNGDMDEMVAVAQGLSSMDASAADEIDELLLLASRSPMIEREAIETRYKEIMEAV